MSIKLKDTRKRSENNQYYPHKLIMDATVKNNEFPITKLRGEKDKEYVLGIKPSFSSSPKSDYFAISVLELSSNGWMMAHLVHSYQVAGGNLKNHLNYIYSLFEHFNIQLVSCDASGFDALYDSLDFDKIGDCEFEKQYFTRDWTRQANEYLYANLCHRKLMFAGKATAHSEIFNIIDSISPSILLSKRFFSEFRNQIMDSIEQQDFLIQDTKNQCGLVCVSKGNGGLKFDMPDRLKRIDSEVRPRIDGYKSLLIANWAVKDYLEYNN